MCDSTSLRNLTLITGVFIAAACAAALFAINTEHLIALLPVAKTLYGVAAVIALSALGAAVAAVAAARAFCACAASISTCAAACAALMRTLLALLASLGALCAFCALAAGAPGPSSVVFESVVAVCGASSVALSGSLASSMTRIKSCQG